MIWNEVLDDEEAKRVGKEFKREAVALVVEQGYSLAEAGRSLGIRGNLVGRWKRQLEVEQGEAFPGRGLLCESSTSTARLPEYNKRRCAD